MDFSACIRLFLLSFLGCLFVSSCGNNSVDYRYAADVTSEERKACDAGFTLWNAETLPSAQVAYSPEGEWLVSFEDQILYEGQPKGGLTCRGRTPSCPTAQRIYILRGTQKTGLICAHEMGHALGLKHIKDPDSIMSHPAKGERGITDADRAECQRVGSCSSIIVHPLRN